MKWMKAWGNYLTVWKQAVTRKRARAVFNQHDPLSSSYLPLVLSSLLQQAFTFLTVWPPPGDRGTRRRCSVSSSHPSPLPKASHHPEWLKRKTSFSDNILTLYTSLFTASYSKISSEVWFTSRACAFNRVISNDKNIIACWVMKAGVYHACHEWNVKNLITSETPLLLHPLRLTDNEEAAPHPMLPSAPVELFVSTGWQVTSAGSWPLPAA